MPRLKKCTPGWVLRTGATASSIAWVAGLFEGEGCFTPRGNHGWCATIKMTDEDVVRKVHRVLGIGWVCGPYQTANTAHKPTWAWVVSSFQDVQAVAAMLWEHLGARRRAG